VRPRIVTDPLVIRVNVGAKDAPLVSLKLRPGAAPPCSSRAGICSLLTGSGALVSCLIPNRSASPDSCRCPHNRVHRVAGGRKIAVSVDHKVIGQADRTALRLGLSRSKLLLAIAERPPPQEQGKGGRAVEPCSPG